MRQTRQLAAIMFTDIVGYTSLMGKDSPKALELLRVSTESQKRIVRLHGGIWLKEIGDGALVRFNTALDSVKCAIEIQKFAQSELKAQLRIGIHLGDITIENEDIFGDGVNVASRIESITDPGGIYISDAIHKAIQGEPGIQFIFLGEVELKNVAYKIGVYAIQGEGLPIAHANKLVKNSFKNEVSKGGIILTGFIYLIISVLISLWAPSIGLSQLNSLNFIIIIIICLPIVVFGAWRIEKDYHKSQEILARRNLVKRNAIIVGLGIIIITMFYNSLRNVKLEDKSIAVLPFSNMSNDPKQQYFADGMTEDVLNQLSKISALKVTSRTSSEKFRNEKDMTISQIAARLGVKYVLEGSVQKEENTVRITAQLIDAQNDSHIWSENYDRELIQIFQIQTEISKNIAEVLKAKLFSLEQKLLDEKPTTNFTAYDYFLQGRKSLNKAIDLYDSVENELAIGLFVKSLSEDPDLAIAKTYLGKAYMNRSQYFGYDKVFLDSALLLADEALKSNPNLSDSYQLKGAISLDRGDKDAAILFYQKALELNPNSSESYSILGAISSTEEPSGNNLKYQLRSLELDPLNPQKFRTVEGVLNDRGMQLESSESDQYFILVSPNSKLVTVGGRYKAEMFLVSFPRDLNARMYVNKKRINRDSIMVDQDRIIEYGNIDFRVTPGGTEVTGETYRKKSFIAEVNIGDEIYSKEVEYHVTSPSISIYSGVVTTLWRNCANYLTVFIPEIGAQYSPKIEATNAEVIQGSGGNVILIPKSFQNVNMTILNFGDTVGTFDFHVKDIPLPTYKFKIGNSWIDLEKGINANEIRGSLNVEFVADPSFKLAAPQDARYRVEDIDVYLRSGTEARATVSEKSGRVLLHAIQGAIPRSGDYLVIKINRVSRINFREERERIATRGLIFNIPIK